MNRREFMTTGAGGALGAAMLSHDTPARDRIEPSDVRKLFPRLAHDIALNAAGGTPLSTFTERGLRRFEQYWRTGAGPEPWGSLPAMMDDVRARLARLINATPEEIAFTQSTKDGEQVVIDSLRTLREGGNLVTNDLHFAGSLHNYLGLRNKGLDVRIVQSRDFTIPLEDMVAAIDDATALVAVTHVSNVNGRFEPLQELAEIAHAHDALVYADIIQATGIVPVDVKALGIDFAAGNGYKWLFGPFGTGFLYVRRALQGSVLEDRLFPGHARHNYAPWVDAPEPEGGDFLHQPPSDASRYQPGHVNYLGYCCLQEGLKFVEETGVEALQRHSVGLCQHLHDRLDTRRYPCLSPDLDRAPIITFGISDRESVAPRLRAANIFVSLGRSRMRVSPGIYNTEADMDRLAEVLHGI